MQSIEVARLTKARPLDNLEFMQWFKAYFDGITNNQPITDYDGTHACLYGGGDGAHTPAGEECSNPTESNHPPTRI